MNLNEWMNKTGPISKQEKLIAIGIIGCFLVLGIIAVVAFK